MIIKAIFYWIRGRNMTQTAINPIPVTWLLTYSFMIVRTDEG